MPSDDPAQAPSDPAQAPPEVDLADLNGEQSAQLIAAVREGSSEALGALMDACRRYLLLVARAEMGDDLRAKFGASDLVQETFLQAQKNFVRFDGNSPVQLRAWLRQILLHQLASVSRNYRHTAKRRLGRERSLDDAPTGMRTHRWLTTRAASPSQHAVAREENESLEAALVRLPESYLRVIVLRNRERKSFAEIGELLGLSSDAARKLWARAIEHLQQALDPPAVPPSVAPLRFRSLE